MPKVFSKHFVFMMQFNRGCFVVFWNACHWCTQNFKAMMIDQFHMMDLGKANRIISMEIFWLIPRHLMSVRRIEYTGLLSSASDTRIWLAWCTCTSKYYPCRCRVPYLVDEYSSVGFKVHHFPVQEGNVPTMADCSDMIEQLRQCISFGHRTLLQ